MKQIYTNAEKERLLDIIIEFATIVHESGVQIGDKLDLPSHVMWDLRQRSPRADMVSPCKCPDCVNKWKFKTAYTSENND